MQKINWSKVKLDTEVYVIDEEKNHVARHFAGVNILGLPTVFKDGKTSHTESRVEIVNDPEFNTKIREEPITDEWLQESHKESIRLAQKTVNSYLKAESKGINADECSLMIWKSIYLKKRW